MHLPLFAAAASGLFAEHGLDVELVAAPSGGGPENAKRVAAGGADVCLTGVYYYLAAVAESGGDLGARFAAALAQRSPLAAIVREDSDLTGHEHLPGRRLAVGRLTWLVDEFLGAMAERGLGPPRLVTVDPDNAQAPLGRGEVDVIGSWVDAAPRIARKAGVPVRAIPFGVEAYTTGLVAGDHVPDEDLDMLRAAMAEALRRQRDDPSAGSGGLAERYPEADPSSSALAWTALEPYVFAGPEPCSVDPQRWRATVARTAAVHGLTLPEPDRLLRVSVQPAAAG